MVFLKSGKLIKYAFAGFAAALCAACILFWFFFTKDIYPVASFDQVRSSHAKSDAILLDRHGAVLHELRVGFQGRSLQWANLDAISPVLVDAVVISEDKRFYHHNGIDPVAFAHAVAQNILSRDRRGASTITMQLAALIEKRLKPETTRRTLLQKWCQMKHAYAIEKKWSKKEILEAYLNLVSYRGELQGIAAASRGLFDKDPSGLDLTESVILASLIRSPNASAEIVLNRADKLALQLNASADTDQIALKTKEVLYKPYLVRQAANLAPHAAYYLLEPGKKEVTCSLDKELQMFVTEVLKARLLAVKTQNVNDGAIIVADNRTGEILAYVGNSGSASSAIYVDGIRARRQAGSTLKPFLYALAIENRIITAASLMSDLPLDVATDRGVYKPENYDKQFKGLVPARVALASSLNVPAVRLLMMTGTDPFVYKLEQLGFGELKDGDYYGYSLALGTMDITLFELTNAYRTLANGGIWGDLTFVRGENRNKVTRIFSRETTFIISDILSDREARSLTFGLENPLSTRFWSAVKTGTSKDMRDNWCVGYSSEYTVGVWVGNFSGSAMWDVSGITGAAPIWHEIMTYLHRKEKSRPPQPPPGVTAKQFLQETDKISKKEWFLAGTEPVSVGPGLKTGKKPKIIYPPDEVIIAIDPDIPVGQQKIFFEATTGTNDLQWILNGAVVGYGTMCPWKPVGGSYTLKLTDAAAHVLDEKTFTVRD